MTPARKPDFYYRKAKREGLVARSVFKLKELDEKYRLIRPGFKVLDLGASPGSWLDYVSGIIGDGGLAIGVDQNPLRETLRPNMRFLKNDVFTIELAQLREFSPEFDVVISDLAPATTGDRDGDHVRSVELCEKAKSLALQLLAAGGSFVCKMFQGAQTKDFVESLRPNFAQVKIQKPEASRDESREIYIVALDFHSSDRS
ncbi:MAG: RlmE family RNA methyltransferase [Pseudomonadota bacterium]